MAPGSKRSFGSALFDWPAADGYDSADEHAPETWLALLAEKLFGGRLRDPASFRENLDYGMFRRDKLRGLFASCKGGRDLVLGLAQICGLHLALPRSDTSWRSLREWQGPLNIRQVAATRQCLAKRVRGHTLLFVSCDYTEQCAQALVMLPGLLYGAGQGVTELHIEQRSAWEAPLPPLKTWLCCCAEALPNLATLRYEYACSALPEPARLTKLRHLALPDAPATAHMQTMTPAIAAYLPQLESLELRGCEIHDEDKWDLLFNEASTSHTLTRLDITAPLSAELVKLLVQHCPALKELKACGQEPITSEDISPQLQWAVTRVDTFDDDEEEEDVCLDQFVLPRPAEGTRTKVRYFRNVTIPVDTHQGFSPEMYQRVCGLSFEAERVRVVLSDSVETHQHTQALEAVLGQLREMRAPHVLVELMGWHLNTNMLQTFSASLPELSHLKLGVRLHTPLTDALLGVVLQMAPHLRSLSAPSLALQSDTHANTPWPWDELTIDTLDIADLCKLPMPGKDDVCSFLDPGDKKRYVYNTELMVNAEAVTQVGSASLFARLEQITWHTDTRQVWTLVHSPDIMTTLESIYDSLNFGDSRFYAAGIKPMQWPMTVQGMQDLVTLFDWLSEREFDWDKAALDLSSGCTWPERDVSVYEQWAKEHGSWFEKGWKVSSSAPYNVIQALNAGLQAVAGHKKPKLTIVDV